MDKYYVYRPILNLLGKSEGTDKGDGYDETLGYGMMLDGIVTKGKGKDVDLTAMTLAEVDKLQTFMLNDPDNKWNSSACGRYQIVRTTRRTIEKALKIPTTAKFDEDMQDRMACFLLGGRGIDLYLEGKMKEDDLLASLAAEWASLPTAFGKGFYKGQHASVTVEEVRDVLAEVKSRYALRDRQQPVEPPPLETPIFHPWFAILVAFVIALGAVVALTLQ